MRGRAEGEAGAEAEAGPAPPPALYMLVFGVSKKHNVGQLVRSCVAMGVTEVVLAGGSRQYNTFGSHGADAYCVFRYYPTLLEARDYLKGLGVRIVGIEICAGARSVVEEPFGAGYGPTAFMAGNEGTGLNEQQLRICDDFVYVPQYGSGTASLNVVVATTIVLHRFAAAAGFREQGRDPANEFKYALGARPQRMARRGEVPFTDAERRARAEAQQGSEEWLESSVGEAAELLEEILA